MNYKYEVTIAIPVYNVASYVRKSLLSALNQDFDETYEILVVDDKGSDESMDIVKAIKQEHSKGNIIRIVEHTQNKGLGPARNTAIEYAKGRYLFFLDSDDWISSDCLSLLYKKAVENDAEMVVGSICRIEEKTGHITSKTIYKDEVITHTAAGVYLFSLNHHVHIEVWNKLFKLDFLKRFHIGCVHRIMEDYIFDFNLRCNIRKIAFIPNITLFYNIRENSIVTKLRGKHGSDESAYTFSNIIERLQVLVTEKYKNIPGVYDLYYRRITWALEGIGASIYDEKQWIYITEHIKGYHDFIPNSSVLKDPRNWFLYKFDKESQNLNHFYKINRYSESFVARLIFKLIRKARCIKISLCGFFAKQDVI